MELHERTPRGIKENRESDPAEVAWRQAYSFWQEWGRKFRLDIEGKIDPYSTRCDTEGDLLVKHATAIEKGGISLSTRTDRNNEGTGLLFRVSSNRGANIFPYEEVSILEKYGKIRAIDIRFHSGALRLNRFAPVKNVLIRMNPRSVESILQVVNHGRWNATYEIYRSGSYDLFLTKRREGLSFGRTVDIDSRGIAEAIHGVQQFEPIMNPREHREDQHIA